MIVYEYAKSFVIMEDGMYHCDYGPAVKEEDGSERWYIRGRYLTMIEISLAKQILADPKLAPLYLNHKHLKYFCHTSLKGMS